MAEYSWFSLDFRVKLSVFVSVHPESNKFATSVENNAKGDSERNGYALQMI